ncbi:AAA family ATPase [Alkalibacillus haloalkaliphilus]|uniref:AAA family ATPase n=1 Tax=Alkalibacillus haloalkaliphilus TaxID=94136 RepID=UPI0029354D9B|nr:AAA family ATPase [Alkalibacillus haloalkaliphilus]MDV2581461.1 AAA family ATPase [Alkalibacillus haloalkaliphilus]
MKMNKTEMVNGQMNAISNVYVIGDHDELKAMLQEQLSDSFDLKFITTSELKKVEAEIIIIASHGTSPADFTQIILAESSNSSIICVTGQEDFELLRNLNRLGVTDLFVIPGEELLLKERIEEMATNAQIVSQSLDQADGYKRGGGKVFSFYSGSGGVGKSLISSTFAQTLKLESTGKVLFIDLNLQFGGAEAYLGMESNRSIIDLIPVINELGEHHIRNVSETEENSELSVLISPKDAEMAEKITEDFVLRLIRASKRSFDFIIVDLPSWIDERSFIALEEANRIYYIMELNTVSLQVLKGVELLLNRLGIDSKDKLEIVLNYKAKDLELTQKDLERFVSYPVASEIRRDIKNVQARINHGEPLRKEPQEKKLSPFSKDIHKWVHSMLK